MGALLLDSNSGKAKWRVKSLKWFKMVTTIKRENISTSIGDSVKWMRSDAGGEGREG